MSRFVENICGVVVFVAFIAIIGIAGYWDTHYTETMEVTNVFVFLDEKTVVVEDSQGEKWKIPVDFDTEVEVGQKAKVYFFNNETTRTDDDYIDDIKFLDSKK